MYNLSGRHLLNFLDYNKKEISFLIDLAFSLKKAKRIGNEVKHLIGKEIALIFEKESTRTRCSFDVAAYDQGANVTYISPNSSHMGYKESVKDTARVLGRIYDGIEYRGYGQEIIEELAKYAGVPVFNGLTDEYHPTQVVSDVMTMMEELQTIHYKKMSFAFVGDTRSNVANSLLIIASKLGIDARFIGPKSLWPSEKHVNLCKDFWKASGANITITENLDEGLPGAQFVYTDVWLSMGEPMDALHERIKILRPYQINSTIMAKTQISDSKFMHCLPAFHNLDTKFAQDLSKQYPEFKNGIEVTEDVFEGSNSIVFDQAENRMHAIKAILVASIGGL